MIEQPGGEAECERWGDRPEFDDLANAAYRRVFNKYSSPGYELDGAQDWAMDLVEEYATEDGIILDDSWLVVSEEKEVTQ
jgi:hypothetical protein